MSDNWRPGPDVPRAFAFGMAFCDDPKCGLHIVPTTRSDEAICEVVMSPEQTLKLIKFCQAKLYEKATKT